MIQTETGATLIQDGIGGVVKAKWAFSCSRYDNVYKIEFKNGYENGFYSMFFFTIDSYSKPDYWSDFYDSTTDL